MPATQEIVGGEQGQKEIDAYLDTFRTRFHNARERKPKRARGHYKRFLNTLRSNPKLALLPLPKELFNTTSLTSCQTSFDQNAEKLELDVRQYSVYEHIDMTRVLVDWNHPEVEAQFDAWVLAHTPMPSKNVTVAASEIDKLSKDKEPPKAA